MNADSFCFMLIFLPSCLTVIAARILIYQLRASPQRMGRLGAILGAACLIWIALAGLMLWSQHTCNNLPVSTDPDFDPCAPEIRALTYPVLANAGIVFAYALIHLLWALHWVRHEMW